MRILPTHTCFDDALDYLGHLATRKDPTLRRHVLVHGICTVNKAQAVDATDGEPFAHAWVEYRGQVIQGGILAGAKVWWSSSIDDFHETLNVLESTRYTVEEASAENMRTGHYGPWVEKYEELTRTAKRARQAAG